MKPKIGEFASWKDFDPTKYFTPDVVTRIEVLMMMMKSEDKKNIEELALKLFDCFDKQSKGRCVIAAFMLFAFAIHDHFEENPLSMTEKIVKEVTKNTTIN